MLIIKFMETWSFVTCSPAACLVSGYCYYCCNTVTIVREGVCCVMTHISVVWVCIFRSGVRTYCLYTGGVWVLPLWPVPEHIREIPASPKGTTADEVGEAAGERPTP